MYTVGMEEEYFVFDAKTRRAARRMNGKFLKSVGAALGDHVMTEMLQSQIEVATPPSESMAEARSHLLRYRQALAEATAAHKLGVAALGTSRWRSGRRRR
jgi:carboxylate-amine ligase